ncbi:MAG: PIN domain-containing protein [Phycisphaerae bacterium]|nr:PIN domain-containing protein [Phycisphaerae bacterium]
MHKLSIYVETSVWSYAFAEDAPESRKATEDFFELARQNLYELFVCDVVLDELGRAPEELARMFGKLVQEIKPVNLEFDREADRLAQQFLQLGAVPPSKIEDAQHVAVAVVNELDMLVSWNYQHLVNVRKRQAFEHISAINGYYKPLHIITPLEVGDES